MPATVSREEYLRTLYRPDLDWLDGTLGERHLGDLEHSIVVGSLLSALGNEQLTKAHALPSLRLQVSEATYRVTDVCLVSKAAPRERIPCTAPLLCIEVLSPGDRATYLAALMDDLLVMGVPEIWLLDPRRRKAWVVDANGQRCVEKFTVPGTQLTLSSRQIFAELDELETHGR